LGKYHTKLPAIMKRLGGHPGAAAGTARRPEAKP
jgi:hypothetical protein